VTLTLRGRLFIAHALVLLAALAAMLVIVAREERGWLIDHQRATLEREARWLAATLPHDPDAARGDWTAAAGRAGEALGARVTLIAGDGRVLGDSRVPAGRLGAVENHAARTEVRAALGGAAGHALRRSETLAEEQVYVAVPAGEGPVAVVRLAEPLTLIAALRASLMGLTLLAALLTLLGSLVLVYWLTARQVKRVRELEAAAARIAAGDPGAHALEQPGDELGRLARAINRMAEESRGRLAALERQRDERERILAHLSDGVVLLDAAGRVLHCNVSLATILGLPLPAAPGTPFPEYARAPELDDLVRAARESNEPRETDLRQWTPRMRLVRATASSLGGGSPAPVLLVVRDLTEMEALSRVRQDFVANVSHELRTPLTSLRGYAETLLDGGLEDVEHREGFVQIIREQAVRLEALVADLLSLAELERPGAQLRAVDFDLRELVERHLAGQRMRAERAGLALTLAPGEPLPLTADLARVEQVVANLLDNALKYTERGGVTVSLGGDGARVWCEVADTGPGIPGEDQPRIFERFYRVDKARSRDKGGTGLGLSIVKHIASLHGGEVSVESAVGEGSRFRFWLPRRPGAGGPAR